MAAKKKSLVNTQFLNEVEIKNFKSIKHLKFKPKRVNLFIGKPNSGKSNLLEALSLLGETYSRHEGKFLEGFIRFDSYSKLFFNVDQSNPIEIKTNLGNAWIRYLKVKDMYDFVIGITDEEFKEVNTKPELFDFIKSIFSKKDERILQPYYNEFSIKSRHAIKQPPFLSPVKRYYFQPELVNNYSENFTLFLKSSGANLYSIIEGDAHLRDVASNFFAEYKLDIVFDEEHKKFLILKRVGQSVYSLPLAMTPDTFQRLLYYLAAIYSNNNSILLFEEPEAHSFPPYISMICELIGKKPDNQYFISTHSPYVYQSIVSNTNKVELAIWALSYRKGQTIMTALTEKQISETLADGVDIFQNIERYTK